MNISSEQKNSALVVNHAWLLVMKRGLPIEAAAAQLGLPRERLEQMLLQTAERPHAARLN
ncbi:MAG TPA: hypothetical protein VJS42_04845 [Steroidobacteraceae bacterium]|nr:hypothetical protein [Steroidobacteraceae bacterium]